MALLGASWTGRESRKLSKSSFPEDRNSVLQLSVHLCMHPEILLFDEVTAALDPEMVREVLDVMLRPGCAGAER